MVVNQTKNTLLLLILVDFLKKYLLSEIISLYKIRFLQVDRYLLNTRLKTSELCTESFALSSLSITYL